MALNFCCNHIRFCVHFIAKLSSGGPREQLGPLYQLNGLRQPEYPRLSIRFPVSKLAFHSMNRYRGPSNAASSKATPQTLCQKCLKKDELSIQSRDMSPADLFARHYSYECKAPAQERPYLSRPSRTQQLANPKLLPTLTSDVPNDLLRKYVVRSQHRIVSAVYRLTTIQRGYCQRRAC